MPQRLFLLLLLLANQLLPAQQATNDRVLARAELATNSIEIGDQLWLEVSISAPPGTTVSGLPAGYLNTLPGLEALQEKDLNTVAKTPELLLQQRFLVTSFDTGYIAIPPLPYVFQAANGQLDTAFTNDLLLHVRAFPVGEDDELRPIKPIIEEPLNWLDFWPLYLAIALGAIGYTVWFNRKRRQRLAPPPPPPPPAHVVAIRELDELEKKELWQQERTKDYYSELTRILREYLEGRFDVQAMEMTTRQITTALERRMDFAQEQSSELSQLLQLSDLVKFAKARPAVELHAEGLRRVREFVQETGERAAPAAEPAPVAVPAPPTVVAPASAPTAASEPAIANAQSEEE